MHFLYFTTIQNKDEAENSQEARQMADILLENEAFCYAEGGFFRGGKCDWYVIGGHNPRVAKWIKKALKINPQD